ncbi:MAG: YetF domain-containing protein [Rhodothermales bacterium]
MFFNSWDALGRILLVGTLAYVALVFVLRISGKRTLSKMNAFDFVVTVALGSTLASTILSKDTALAEGVLALALLIGLQFFITWCSVRWEWFQSLVKSVPTLIYYRGEFQQAAMKRERVTTEEVRSAVRKHGNAKMADVAAVVLESDGSFTVMSDLEKGDAHDALANVEGTSDRPHLQPGQTKGAVA